MGDKLDVAGSRDFVVRRTELEVGPTYIPVFIKHKFFNLIGLLVGLSDADVWANSEDLNSILENCLRFVIIDKALLACLLVIELLDLRKACAKLEDMKPLVNDIAQDNVTSTGKTQDESLGVKGNITAAQDNKTKVPQTEMISPRGSVSPRREKLSSLKHTRTELEDRKSVV